MIAMKMLWLLLSTLLLHQAVAMEPIAAMSEIIPATVDEKVQKINLVCPDGSQCPDGNTCCKSASGGYGCCPLPNAVCCSDGEHCCPEGYTCDVSAGTCTQQSETIQIFTNKLAIENTKVKVVQCNATSFCPDGNTCCRLASGQWGCCPLPNAVCCSDGEHCCPHGYTCSGSTCQQESRVTKLFKKNPAIQVKVVQCNATSFCPDGNTCCRLASGQWGCCPLPNAVCCSDGEHCCPHGYTCSGSTCQQESRVTKLFKKNPAIQVEVVQCNATSFCPDANTCCRLASGEWGCCPLPNAVCCSDGEHCCPHGYTCSGGTCQQESRVTKLYKNNPAIQVKVVQCNATSFCPDGNTCCRLASGQWGCCPLPNAVCCSDGEHCCPHGYTCSGSTCQQESRVTKLFKKNPAIQVEVVQCNATSFCPDANTCCRLASGEWGCCPLPNAVCCSDGEHCCPHGYTCSGGTCQQESRVTKLFKKNPAIQVKVVQCNATSFCPDGNTCCRLASGEWGCCPLPNAVCCSDGEHCCPHGYTCSGGTCQQESRVTKLYKNNPAIQVKVVQCNATAYCPDGNTCCKLPSGEWGCCPSPNAVCCSDHEHCCPQGYTCTSSSCQRESHVTKLFKKNPAIQVKSVVCPGGTAQCPDGNTCCKLPSGQWGCCPLPNAVCCSDHEHCCPHGYTCDVSAETCKQQSESIQIFTNKLSIQNPKVKGVVCPGGQSECPDRNTCCKLSSGQWGCCPLPEAVCCSDGVHCCPHGYTCSGDQCLRESHVTRLFKKNPARQVVKPLKIK